MGFGFLNAAWSLPEDLSAESQEIQTPQIAVDANGNATAVWLRSNGINWIIQASTKPFNGIWQAIPNDLSADGQNAFDPQIAVDANGNATAVWTRSNGINNITQSSTKPFNGSWQGTPDDLSALGQDALFPQIVVDANGNATAVWGRFNGTNWIIQSSTKPFNGTWQAIPDDLSVPGQTAWNPQIAVDANGNATAVWWRFNGTNDIIQSSAKPFGGSWQGTPDNLSTPGQSADFPQIAVDADGNATAVWRKSNGTNVITQSSTKPFNGSWQAIPDDLSAPVQDVQFPQIAVDANGNATAVWARSNGTEDIIQSSTKPFNGTWQATPDDLSAPGQGAAEPQIAVDANGDVTAVWMRNNGTNVLIQASTKLFGGSWQAVPEDLSALGQDAAQPQISMNANGNAAVVWMELRGTNFIIQASTQSQPPPSPVRFKGKVKRSGHKLFIKTTWKRSTTNTIVRYEIFARHKRIKKISAHKRPRATIHLHPLFVPHHISKKYRHYIHNKYKIRSVDTAGTLSPFTQLQVRH
jgi:hypothetical protein